jgi:hypothetical protein
MYKQSGQLANVKIRIILNISKFTSQFIPSKNPSFFPVKNCLSPLSNLQIVHSSLRHLCNRKKLCSNLFRHSKWLLLYTFLVLQLILARLKTTFFTVYLPLTLYVGFRSAIHFTHQSVLNFGCGFSFLRQHSWNKFFSLIISPYLLDLTSHNLFKPCLGYSKMNKETYLQLLKFTKNMKNKMHFCKSFFETWIIIWSVVKSKWI